MAVLIASCATAFLITPPLHSAQSSPPLHSAHALTSSEFPRSAVHRLRARRPLAFHGESDDVPHIGSFVPFDEEKDAALESSLSDVELRALLSRRGVDAPADADMNTLVDMLHSSLPVPDPLELDPRERERVDVFARVSPSVAFIQTTVATPGLLSFLGAESEYPAGAGSGFVWDEHGHIVTNHHVIAGGPSRPNARGKSPELPRKVLVKLPGCDGQVEAKIVGSEPDKDLCVLKVDPSALQCSTPLRPIDLGTSSTLRVGQSVLAIGNPFGLDFTLTTGICSAVGRHIKGAGGRPIKDCIQTDAAINPGNSGGPLLDSRGRLVGVNTMIYSPGGLGANVGVGFAIPADIVQRVVTQIIEHGPNARPSLGVSILPDELRDQYSRQLRRKLEGAVITEVVKDSPADTLKLAACERRHGGVLLGDMITEINGTRITQNEDLLCAMEELRAIDEPVQVEVMRGCDPARVEQLQIMPVRRQTLM